MNIYNIKENLNNPRKISKIEFEKLVKSIQEDPNLLLAKPIIIDENNIILGGNQRYKACLQLNILDVPVIQMSNLDERQKKKLLVIDNTHNGEWDMDIFANDNWELTELSEWGVDLNFLNPITNEPENIDNAKGGKSCPNCGVTL
jgi:ParB-like chromosome segregation protein Spo0J